MAQRPRGTSGSQDSPPREFPQTPPPVAGADYSFTLQAIMELQKAVGELTGTIKELSGDVKENSTKLERISHIVYAAAAVVAVLSIIGGFILDKIWDKLISVLAAVS